MTDENKTVMGGQSHTPGPWERGDGAANGCAGYIYCDDATGSAVASVVFSPDFIGRSDAETEANARLIAAAPELLEALKEIVKACEECEADENMSIVDAFTQDMEDAARAAIAKATGESGA